MPTQPKASLELQTCRVERFAVSRGTDSAFDLKLEVISEGRTYQLELSGGRDPEGLTDRSEATSLRVEQTEGELNSARSCSSFTRMKRSDR